MQRKDSVFKDPVHGFLVVIKRKIPMGLAH